MTTNNSCSQEKYSKVLILGAGISGIAAAKTLHDSGVEDFVILEGTDRIGGRIRHTQWHDTSIELGANWIHGTVNNPVYELAQKYGVKGKLDRRTYVIRDKNGARVTAKGRLTDLKHADEKLEEIISTRANLGLGDISLKDTLKHAGWTASTPEENATEYWLHDFMEATTPSNVYSGTETARASINDRENRIMSEHDEQQFFVTDPRGYVHLVDRIAAEFLTEDDPRLQLNRRVEAIEWSKDSVRVKTTAGHVYKADFALITFSTGVITSGLVQFKPQLPVRKQQVFAKFDMVIYTKIFLKFPTLFWDREEYVLYASQSRGRYAIWENLEANSRLPKGTNILLITVTGDEAVKLESQSNEKTQMEIMEILRKVYGSDIPNPIDMLYPRWGDNEFFLGSWANPSIGVTSEDFAEMCAPVGRLFFAGEATSELYHANVHGGYLSGLARGEDIVNSMILNNV